MAANTGERLKPSHQEMTLKDLSPNVAGLLCYVAGWISGIVFLVLEQKNRFVRFHALQSIITFGALSLAGAILGHIPFIGIAFSWIFWITGFTLWIILMLKAQSGDTFKIPWAGNLAEKLTSESLGHTGAAADAKDSTGTPANVKDNRFAETPHLQETPFTAASPAAVPADARSVRREAFKTGYYSSGARTGRTVGSIFAIAWSFALLIFFNFFNHYIAFYQADYSGGTVHWTRSPLLTSEFNSWLPILTTALVLTIIGHFVMIVVDKYLLRQITHIILDIFGLATVIALLSIFPFDFSVIPGTGIAYWLPVGITITLIMIAIGIGIGALVRFISLIVNVAEGKV